MTQALGRQHPGAPDASGTIPHSSRPRRHSGPEGAGSQRRRNRGGRAAALTFGALLLCAAAQQTSPAQLRELVAALVAQARAQTPMQVDEGTVWSGVRADGVEIIYDITIERDLGAAEIAARRRVQEAADPISLCANHTVAYLVGLGARVRQIYTDASGDRFETLVARCAGGTG